MIIRIGQLWEKCREKTSYRFGWLSALQSLKCFSFCWVRCAFRGIADIFPRFCPFFFCGSRGLARGFEEPPHFHKVFIFRFFPLCNLLKILPTWEIWQCFIFPWPICALSGAWAAASKPQMKHKEFATSNDGKLILLHEDCSGRSSSRKREEKKKGG